jgi:site-specific DNA-methyltransferase (adenine-specific)
MSAAAVSVALKGRNPDVLTSISNLSNDEVFTPPEFASRMLDNLERYWALANNGEVIWENSTITFLDPFTKSGVFLREITKRLIEGLNEKMPNLQERVDHILTNQVFGVAITEITALIARRSVYCAKSARSEHSICRKFETNHGNIWFEKTFHTWTKAKKKADGVEGDSDQSLDGKCTFCGANRRDYDREALETYAYPFLHTNNPLEFLQERLGKKMKFDVVIGNPPYQLGQSGGDSVGGFAMPIYQKFVESAKRLEPRFISMITPSRWFAGGRGLDDFRAEMLADQRLRTLIDYPYAKEVFPGTKIEGGVSYFLWDSTWKGACDLQTIEQGKPTTEPMARNLGEFDVLVRRNEAIPILHKILKSSLDVGTLAEIVRPIQPFGLRTNFLGTEKKVSLKNGILLYRNGGTSFVELEEISKNRDLVSEWKVLLGRAYGSGGSYPLQVYNTPIVAPPNSACTETYLVVGVFGAKSEAENYATYLSTRFARFLVSLRKNTQDMYSDRFSFVPMMKFDKPWTDDELYSHFGLTKKETDFIASMVRAPDSEIN